MSDFLYRLCLRLEQWLTGGRSQANVAAMRALDYDHYVRINRQPPTKYATKTSKSKSDIYVRVGGDDTGQRRDTEDRRGNNHFPLEREAIHHRSPSRRDPKRWDVSVNNDGHASTKTLTRR